MKSKMTGEGVPVMDVTGTGVVQGAGTKSGIGF